MKTRSICKSVAALVLTTIFSLALFVFPAQAKRETHQFRLYPGKNIRRPYILIFPISVTRPGQIRVHVRLNSFDTTLQHAIVTTIIQKGKKKAMAYGKSVKDRTSIHVKYPVDSIDLEKSNQFEIRLGNFSVRRPASGELLIDYPVAGETDQGATPIYPDLAIAGLRLNANCQVQVTLTNKGPGRLSLGLWEKDIPQIRILRNGKAWGGANLKVIDPQKKLRQPGARMVYTSRLKVAGTETITAVIEPGPRLREADTRNNRAQARLTCAGAALPDLAVTELKLVGGCRVAVRIANMGPGALPDSAWQPETSPTVYLLRNGRSWGGANLKAIDPRKRLRRKGGWLFYTSNLKVGGTEQITAVVDYNKVLREHNEANNSLQRRLTCGQ